MHPIHMHQPTYACFSLHTPVQAQMHAVPVALSFQSFAALLRGLTSTVLVHTQVYHTHVYVTHTFTWWYFHGVLCCNTVTCIVLQHCHTLWQALLPCTPIHLLDTWRWWYAHGVLCDMPMVYCLAWLWRAVPTAVVHTHTHTHTHTHKHTHAHVYHDTQSLWYVDAVLCCNIVCFVLQHCSELCCNTVASCANTARPDCTRARKYEIDPHKLNEMK